MEVDIDPDDDGGAFASKAAFTGDPAPTTRSAATPAFGDIDLALDLPAPAKPSSSRSNDAVSRFDIDEATRTFSPAQASTSFGGGGFGEIDLPAPALGTADLPSPQIHSDLPRPVSGATRSPSVAPAAGFGNLDLGGATQGSPALPTAAQRSPAASPNPFQAPAPDDSFDRPTPVEFPVAGPSAAPPSASFAPHPAMKIGTASAEPAEPKSNRNSNGSKYAIVGVVVAALAGSALAMVPGVGAFGFYVISDAVNASSNRRALDTLRSQAQSALDADTVGEAGRAIADARGAHDSLPRYKPISGYAAYVAFVRNLRFGKRGDDDVFAKQLVATFGDSQDPMVVLATAGQDAATGQLARARQSLNALSQRVAGDVDVAVIAGEVELLAKDSAQGVDRWTKAVALKRSARTLYGLARAQRAAGDVKSAEATANETLKIAPNHAGSRILLASLTWMTASREKDAIALLTKVVEDPAVRSGASGNELVDAYTVLGRIHLGRSRMTLAEKAFAEALKLDPQALQALTGNGELFYRAGRFTEALGRFVSAMQADPDNVSAQVGSAKTKLAMGNAKEAKEALKKLRGDKPKEIMVAYWLGRTEEALGNRKEAEANYVESIKAGGESTPEVVEAFVALARLLSANGKPEEATAKLSEANKLFPGSPALDKARGELALEGGRLEEAVQSFQRALAHQEDLGARFLLGVTERRLRHTDAALKLFDEVTSFDKDFPGLALERGLLFEQTGQSDRAIEMYNDALRKAPDDLDLQFRVASTQVTAGHAKQAIPLLRELQRKRGMTAEINHFLGRALLVSGSNLAEAMRFLKVAADQDPTPAQYWLYVGWAGNEIGQPAEAEQALARALERDKNLGDAYWQRGVLLQKQGQTRDALEDLKTALAKNPSRIEAYATMASCYQDQTNWKDAEVTWRKAIAGNNDVAEWRYRFGKLLYNHGSKPESAKELTKAVELADKIDAKPGWLFDAHLLLGEALKASDRSNAILHFQRFLELAPTDNAYRGEVEKTLASLGVKPR